MTLSLIASIIFVHCLLHTWTRCTHWWTSCWLSWCGESMWRWHDAKTTVTLTAKREVSRVSQVHESTERVFRTAQVKRANRKEEWSWRIKNKKIWHKNNSKRVAQQSQSGWQRWVGEGDTVHVDEAKWVARSRNSSRDWRRGRLSLSLKWNAVPDSN